MDSLEAKLLPSRPAAARRPRVFARPLLAGGLTAAALRHADERPDRSDLGSASHLQCRLDRLRTVVEAGQYVAMKVDQLAS